MGVEWMVTGPWIRAAVFQLARTTLLYYPLLQMHIHLSGFTTSRVVYNIYTWFVGSKHSHWFMVVRTILLWQVTECSLVGRWSFSVMISELWRFA
jgi:hypothetical protein